MKNKQLLGQFFTTNCKYIIGNLLEFLPKDATICDPFAGNWDLLNLISDNLTKIAYDIEPQNQATIQKDSLSDPANYENKWIVTNPPYLARNKNNIGKSSNKFKKTNEALYNSYQLNDLYKIALKTIMSCEGGIIIVPLNFFCEEISDFRSEFLSNFVIKQLNVFEEQVFDDTSYTVCSFFFTRQQNKEQSFPVHFFPSNHKETFVLKDKTKWKLGSEFYDLINTPSNIKVWRLCEGDESNSNIKLRAIDTGSGDGRIKLEYTDTPYVDTTPNRTDRCFASLNLSVSLNQEQQLHLIRRFNEILEENRDKYHSLFLTNFRNSTKNYARKRISFDVAYQLVRHIIETELKIC